MRTLKTTKILLDFKFLQQIPSYNNTSAAYMTSTVDAYLKTFKSNKKIVATRKLIYDLIFHCTDQIRAINKLFII